MYLLAVIIVIFVLGVVFKIQGSKAGNILMTFAVVFASIIFGWLGLIMISFASAKQAILMLVFGVFHCLVTSLAILWIWGGLKKKAVWIPIVSALGVCVLTAGGVVAYEAYDKSIPQVSASGDIYEYLPYGKNTKVASLDEKSRLSLDSDLPVMDGATALFPIYSAFAKAVYPPEEIKYDYDYKYQEDNGALKCTKTTQAYENIVTGEADIIFVAGPSEAQEKFAKQKGVELVYTPIGKEAFVFFVNAKNPIDNITVEQIQKIYSGEITSWDELGIEKLGDIRAFQRDEGSGSQSALERLMKGKKLMPAPKADVVTGMGGIIERTADYKNYKNAIGYSFRFYSTQMVKNNQIKLLKINGVYPDLKNIENGKYPIASDFYAVTRSDASENTKRLLRWILSSQGQEIIEKTGYTPIKK